MYLEKGLILALMILAFGMNAQFAENDLLLIQNRQFTDKSHSEKRQVSYVFKNKNWFIKFNPMSLLAGGSLYLYQAVISPQIMQGCAFHPSCSNFSKESMNRFGFLKGVALSADRLTRCTRLSAIDFHPVLFTEDGKVKDIPEYYTLQK